MFLTTISDNEEEYNTSEGYSFGFLKGLSIGLELGFMETAVQLGESGLRIDNIINFNSNHEAYDILIGEMSKNNQREVQRISKRRAELLKRIQAMPRTNFSSSDTRLSNTSNGESGNSSSSSYSDNYIASDNSSDIDFESEIRSIRALFMQCSSPVGSLVNKAAKADQREW